MPPSRAALPLGVTQVYAELEEFGETAAGHPVRANDGDTRAP
jgi:hypothetical protein